MITIYGAEWCNYCKKAKTLAQTQNLPFEWKNVEDLNIYEELQLARPGYKTIPQIFWDGRYVGGYTELAQEVENVLGGNYGNGTF